MVACDYAGRAMNPTSLLRLNLGCGQNRLPGCVNVDKFGAPDVRCDLEVFPWPWPDNSVAAVVLNHVLEHLGASAATYIGIFQELYRVCAPGARIEIAVPHPRHDDFLNDPTHVRAVTPDGLELFCQRKNREWAAQGVANSPLGLSHGVNFEVADIHLGLDPRWLARLERGEVTEAALREAIRTHNNVVKETRMTLVVVK